MKLNTIRVFSLLTLLVLPIFLTQTRNPKAAYYAAANQSNADWATYGDNWSSWANQWGEGWSEDEKDGDLENENVTLFGSKVLAGKRIKKISLSMVRERSMMFR